MHILTIIWNIIIIVTVGMLFSDSNPNFLGDLLWIFVFGIITAVIILRKIYKINKSKSYISIHLKKEASEDMRKIRELAVLYIENRIKSDKDDLSFDDYKKFNNIVQIENNIKMWDKSIQDFEMILAARDAQIHDDIMKIPDGYQHKLTSGGRDLSGGQRQRMEIARVLAQDPSIIILDEATSALDARTEYEVVNAIKARGITCIVIAHRLSTVRDCDEIIVLDNGKVLERGKHEDLINKGGAYSELVAND